MYKVALVLIKAYINKLKEESHVTGSSSLSF